MNPKIAEVLKHGTALHNKLAEALKDRLRISEKRMKDRYTTMGKNEELFQAYIPEQDVDALRRTNREVSGIPEYRTIELPYSFATVMTAHTYFTSVFLSRSPVLQLASRHGEPEMKRAAMEALLAYQIQIGLALIPLFVWLLDPAKYGYGVIGHFWDTEMTRVRTTTQEPVTFLGIPIPDMKGGVKTRTVDSVEDVIGYEGNRTYNVRAQDFFPDPRVALVHFQKGEFCARYVETAWNEIYEGVRGDIPRYFNYDVLKQLRQKGDNVVTVPARDTGGRATTLPGETSFESGPGGLEGGYDVPVGFIKGHEVYLKLIPRDWKLGSEDRQEIWVFNIASNGVIFGAVPLGEYHGKFPFDILLDEVDGYTIFPKSTLERVKPLSDVLTWLINTHFYNVRQTLNNQFVVDPSMLVMKDVENPEPGKIMRLKPAAYGKDVRTAIHQLQTVDVTSRHIQDVPLIQEIIERITGASASMQGIQQAGGRKTATEVRTSTSFGVNRLKTQCEWFGITGFSQYTQKLVQRTQQRYTQEKQFKIVGDLAQFSPQFAMVTPADIAGFYDYEPVDGTLPVDRFAQANLWQMIMAQMVNYPQILQQYDIVKIFAWVANLAGIKNMTQFRLVPDEQLLQNAQAGNVVPISQAGSKTNTNLNEPKQVPAVGPTG